MHHRPRAGTSLIDLVISIGIIAVLFGGIYLVYFSIITAIGNIDVRNAASTAISQELETIRNLPYDSVGTIAGAPAGIIPQVQMVAVNDYSVELQTTIRNIDDPFDGTLGGVPNDTSPADYKLVTIDATCPLCNQAIDVEITTTVAPKNLESATQAGSLFIYALDAGGNAISDATVHVVNASVTPSIDLTDTTNASGVLELVGIPTSTQNYSITVTKQGYSTDGTLSSTMANPNPKEPNITVAMQTLSKATFSIDRLSQINLLTSDNRCTPIPNMAFSFQGGKLIGTNPNVLKFSTTSTTNASGSVTLQNIEWDTYTFGIATGAENLAGTTPLLPLTINPSSTVSFRFVLQTAANPSLLVNVTDSATGAGVTNANVTLSKIGYASTLVTGHATISQTDWSGSGQSGYASQDGGIYVDPILQRITLLPNASGTYATSTTSWLISDTFDVGGSHSTFYEISWNPSVQPPQTGTNSLSFQVAANNDNATWIFIGPDGTVNTFFTTSSSLPASLSGDRYFRYKAYLNTQNGNYTPELDDVSFNFLADCVPASQVLFTSLPQGIYTLDVTASNYGENSTTVSVNPGFQSSTISLIHA